MRIPQTEPSADALAASALPTNVARYQVRELLGRGGMGAVVLVQDPRLRRELAIKQLHHDDETSRLRFIEEAQITAQLQHPNIVPVYDIGFERLETASPGALPSNRANDGDGRPFLAMKRVEGKTLRAAISAMHRLAATDPRAGRRELRRLIEAFVKVCDAVAYAHSRGVIHRDLKPENIMVGAFGEVLVMDWGLAKPIGHTPDAVAENTRLGDDAESGAKQRPGRGHQSQRRQVQSDRRELGIETLRGVVKGTPAFMPPEQALGGQSLDEGCDVYALGAVLYVMLTNSLPVQGDTIEDIISRVIEHRIEPLAQHAPPLGVPRELGAIVSKAMARRRRDRYANAAELRDDVQAYLDNDRVSAAPYNPLQTLVKWAARHPMWSLGSVVGSLALLAVVTVGALLYREIVAADARAREQELQAVAAAARQAEAEQIARREAADRARANVDARLARAAEAAARGELGEVRRELDAKVLGERDAAIHEFGALWKQRHRQGVSNEDFANEMGETRLRRYLAAYDRLIDTVAPMTGLPLESADFFHRAFIRSVFPNPDWQGILTDYDRAIELDPKNSLAYFNRGVVKRDLGDLEGEMRDYNRAIELDPDAAEAYHNRAARKRSAGDLPGALRDLDHAVRANPNFSAAYYNRGSVKALMGNDAEAIRDYNRAIELNPRFFEAHCNRGVARRRLGDHAGAIRDYDRAIEINPDYAMVYNHRASLRAAMRNVQGAMDDFDRAIALDPTFTDALNNRGALKAESGNYAEAIRDYDRAIELNPTGTEAFTGRGMAKTAMGNRAGALPDIERAIELAPQNWRARTMRAQLRINIDREGSISDFQHAYRHCDIPNAKQQIANALRQLGASIPD